MSFEDFIIKVAAPIVTVLIILYDRVRKIVEARNAERAKLKKEEDTNERMLKGMENQIVFLRQQLDDCLDDSRKEPPWNKS